MNRRNFIQQSCFACLATSAGLSILTLESCSTTQVITAVPENGKVLVDLALFANDKKALIVRTKQLEHDILVLKTENNYHALYLQCTHQNNPVNYNSGGIVCNAHGSQFDLQGVVKVGPADKALKRFTTSNENNSLTITIN